MISMIIGVGSKSDRSDPMSECKDGGCKGGEEWSNSFWDGGDEKTTKFVQEV